MMQLSKAEPVILTYKGQYRLGSVSPLLPDGDQEIVLCAHTSFPIEENFINELKEAQPNRLILEISDELDLAQRQDVFRRINNKLERLTPEQTEIASKFLSEVDLIEL